MLSLGMLLHLQRRFDSYGAAGLVLAALCVGQAVSGPLTSRLMGRLGMRRLLLATTSICALAITGIAALALPLPGYAALGLIAGLSYPPVQPAVRTIYPTLVTQRQLTPLFSLDASAQEIIWIAGPVVVTFVATQISTVAGVALAVAFLVGGGLWFALSPEVGRSRIPRSTRRFGAVLSRQPVLVATLVGFMLVGTCAATEAGVVSVYGTGGAEAGVILGIWALASLVGGLALGHLQLGRLALAARMTLVATGVTLAALVTGFWPLTGVLVIAGIGIAPALATMFAIVSASVQAGDAAEAYGWVGTGQLIGAAAGSAAAGFLIDGIGSAGAFWCAAGFAVLGALIAVLVRRALPDLRARRDAPAPNTEAALAPQR